VDASDAEFIDASVVGTLFQLARDLRAQGRDLSLVYARVPQRPIWRLTGWSDVCPPLPSRPAPTVSSA
jgi:anti-anti-sigma regulatory factor